jgi:hypothetical protein
MVPNYLLYFVLNLPPAGDALDKCATSATGFLAPDCVRSKIL